MNSPAASPRSSRRRGYLASVLRQRCPRCHHGFVYRRTLQMNNRCPACGMGFIREPGFYSGSPFIGLVFAFPISFFLLWMLLEIVPTMSILLASFLAFVLYLPLLPLTLRISRVLWLEIGAPFSPEHYTTESGDDDGEPEVTGAPVAPAPSNARVIEVREESVEEPHHTTA